MVGLRKHKHSKSENEETPKNENLKFFRRLRHRIAHAFHSKNDTPTSKERKKHEIGDGDDITDVAYDRQQHTPSASRSRTPGDSSKHTFLSSGARATSVSHLHGAQGSGDPSSASECPASTFRNELNEKLRLRPMGNSPYRGAAGAKSAGSSGSLISDDSALYSAKSSTSLALSGDRILPTDSQSELSPTSPKLYSSAQHKLAVNRQRNRRPPSKITPQKSADSRDVLNDTDHSIDAGCNSFFNSPGSLSSECLDSVPSAELDFIREEDNESPALPPISPPSAVSSPNTATTTTLKIVESKDTDQSLYDSIFKELERASPKEIVPNIPKAAIEHSFPTANDSQSPKVTSLSGSSNRVSTDSSCFQSPAVKREPANRRSVHLNFNVSETRTAEVPASDHSPRPQPVPVPRSTVRPYSMFVGSSANEASVHAPSRPLQVCTADGDAQRVSSLSSPEPSMSVDCNGNEDSQELGTVADRASIFGAKLQSPKSVNNSHLRRRKTDESLESPAQTDNRVSRVFDLVKNFEGNNE